MVSKYREKISKGISSNFTSNGSSCCAIVSPELSPNPSGRQSCSPNCFTNKVSINNGSLSLSTNKFIAFTKSPFCKKRKASFCWDLCSFYIIEITHFFLFLNEPKYPVDQPIRKFLHNSSPSYHLQNQDYPFLYAHQFVLINSSEQSQKGNHRMAAEQIFVHQYWPICM